MQKMIVVESDTPISKSAYYFTAQNIMRLDSYSKPVSYFMLICIAILEIRILQGQDIIPVVAVGLIVVFICIFMRLWVYPKERRMPEFSFSEIKGERSAKQVKWSDISKMKIMGKRVEFSEQGTKRSGRIKGDEDDAVKLLKSKLGKKLLVARAA